MTAPLALAPLLLLFAEEVGLPTVVPSDAILGYVGYSLTKSHSANLGEAFAVALIAVICGASLLFVIARRWGQAVLVRLSRFIFLKQKHLDKAEHLFAKYGIWTIIFGRHIPGLRVPITVLAATSGIRYRTFILSTIASTVVWILFYLKLGNRYGGDIQHSIRGYLGLSIGVIAAVIVVLVGLHVWGRYRQKHEQKA